MLCSWAHGFGVTDTALGLTVWGAPESRRPRRSGADHGGYVHQGRGRQVSPARRLPKSARAPVSCQGTGAPRGSRAWLYTSAQAVVRRPDGGRSRAAARPGSLTRAVLAGIVLLASPVVFVGALRRAIACPAPAHSPRRGCPAGMSASWRHAELRIGWATASNEPSTFTFAALNSTQVWLDLISAFKAPSAAS